MQGRLAGLMVVSFPAVTADLRPTPKPDHLEALVRVYAIPTDLADTPWNLELDPTEAQSLIARASTIIEGLTFTARYAVDDDTGLPTSPRIIAAMRDAVCAQASWFDETGDPSGASARYNSLSLGSFSASGGGTGSGTNTTVADSRYSPEAVQILTNAGLINTAPGQL